MKATPFAFDASSSVLQPELGLLIDRGVLSRAELDNTSAANEVERAVERGALTPPQARTMGQLIGLRDAA